MPSGHGAMAYMLPSKMGKPMDMKKQDTKSPEIKERIQKIGRYRVSNWTALISGLLSLLGGIITSMSLVGFKRLSSQQLLIFGSIFAGIVLIAVVLRQIQKMNQKISKLRRKFEEVYISQLDVSFVNPERK